MTFVLAVIAGPACVEHEEPEVVQSLDTEPQITASPPPHLSALPEPGTPEAVGALIVANDCRMSSEVLMDQADLYLFAADSIAKFRAGSDGVCGNDDDRRFGSLDAILELAYVGPRNIERLVVFAEAFGAVPSYQGGTVAGIHFTDAEAFNALTAANAATPERLNREAGLRADAVKNIVAARPIASLQELANVYRVGPRTLENLRNWSSPRVQGGFLLDDSIYAQIEPTARAYFLENEVFAWEILQLADYDDRAQEAIETVLDGELRRRVESSLFGRPFTTIEAAEQEVFRAAAGIKRRVRVDGWHYLHTVGEW